MHPYGKSGWHCWTMCYVEKAISETLKRKASMCSGLPTRQLSRRNRPGSLYATNTDSVSYRPTRAHCTPARTIEEIFVNEANMSCCRDAHVAHANVREVCASTVSGRWMAMHTTLPTLLLSRHYTSRPMGNIHIGGVSSDVDVSQRTFGRRLRRVRTHGARSNLYLSKPSRQCWACNSVIMVIGSMHKTSIVSVSSHQSSGHVVTFVGHG